MQPVTQEGRAGNPRGSGTQPEKEAGTSWFAIAQAHADRAARAGFVVSMMFLASAAIYALSLTGATTAVFDAVAEMADDAAQNAGFRLADLAVSGSKNTPQPVLLKDLNLPYASSLLSYDTAEAHERLLKVGWIASAEVRRILPSRLEVILTEREPFARWIDADNTVTAIDREGNVLGPAEGRFESLLVFKGEEAPAEAAAFMDALPGSIKRRIARAEFAAGRFWLIALDNGLVLKLPRKVNTLVLDRVESLLASPKISSMPLETVDLRLTNRTILQLKDPSLANRDRAIAFITSAPLQPATPPRKGKAL